MTAGNPILGKLHMAMGQKPWYVCEPPQNRWKRDEPQTVPNMWCNSFWSIPTYWKFPLDMDMFHNVGTTPKRGVFWGIEIKHGALLGPIVETTSCFVSPGNCCLLQTKTKWTNEPCRTGRPRLPNAEEKWHGKDSCWGWRYMTTPHVSIPNKRRCGALVCSINPIHEPEQLTIPSPTEFQQLVPPNMAQNGSFADTFGTYGGFLK